MGNKIKSEMNALCSIIFYYGTTFVLHGINEAILPFQMKLDATPSELLATVVLWSMASLLPQLS